MLFDNRKNLFIIMMLLLILSLAGCNQKDVSQLKSEENNNNISIVKLDGKPIISATISRVGESMLDVKKPHITYNQESSIELQTLLDAIKRAEKVNGVVDVLAPDYQITFSFEENTISKYLLWLGDDSGSIMNESDTHTIYILPKDLIDDLNRIVE